ncbi:MAG: hypothetical protein NT159_24695 [Proteobacteria bacterium]|nr:hypothetical protein [Pseudomonadota bacterium]
MPNETTAGVASPPALTWVRFLRNYGPLSTNGNLFDEHVAKALARAKVRPISLPPPRLAEMEAFFTDGIGGSILVAGTAGDGKTYHCRSLWERLGGASATWAGGVPLKRLPFRGREVVFVKDLSELGETEGDEVLEGLERSAAGDDSVSFVVAANHGQILDRLRTRGRRLGMDSPLRDPIQSAFLDPGSSYPRLGVFDLSRGADRRAMESVIAAVADHPEWERCAGCPLDSADRRCPISENRARMLGREDGGLFVRRLGDIVELSRLNGEHLPVRDLLALAANALLGHPAAREGLMTCADVAGIQHRGDADRASVYRNVFGVNLTKKSLSKYPVFRTLSSFGVGEETANGIDGLLVYGSDDSRLSEAFGRLVASDPLYGASAGFLAAQRRYLEGEEGARDGDGDDSFRDRLSDQRRRLFFTLPGDAGESYPFWGLTSFAHAGEYLALVEAVENRRSVDEKTRSAAVRGLNRVMTGLLLENADKIFVSGGGGASGSRVGSLCETEIPARRTGGVGMAIRADSKTGKPCLDVCVAPGSQPVLLDLTPVRFEFLCRVASGALPGSFSNECLEDLLAFKARLLRQAEAARATPEPEGGEPAEGDGTLGLSFIEINDRDGQGAVRRVSVRVGA